MGQKSHIATSFERDVSLVALWLRMQATITAWSIRPKFSAVLTIVRPCMPRGESLLGSCQAVPAPPRKVRVLQFLARVGRFCAGAHRKLGLNTLLCRQIS